MEKMLARKSSVNFTDQFVKSFIKQICFRLQIILKNCTNKTIFQSGLQNTHHMWNQDSEIK